MAKRLYLLFDLGFDFFEGNLGLLVAVPPQVSILELGEDEGTVHPQPWASFLFPLASSPTDLRQPGLR